MEFFNSAIDVLQTLVTAIGAGLAVWGAINLLEGYGNDNPGAKSQGIKQLMAGGGIYAVLVQSIAIDADIMKMVWTCMGYTVLKDEITAANSAEIRKRFHKWGGIPTAISQNVKDLLNSKQAENIFENSDFVLLLKQAPGDRAILAKLLNISPHQFSYVTHSGEGEGLIVYGNTILPFLDHFNKESRLYQVMTTKFTE
jgi:hypothetical protein